MLCLKTKTLTVCTYQFCFSSLYAAKLWCVLGTQGWPCRWDHDWVEKDHLTMPLMQCYFSCCHAQMKTTVGAGRMLLYVFLNVVYSFSSNSNVLCFEPQLNPAGRDPVSKVMVGFGLGTEHLKRSLMSSRLSVTFCSLSYLPGPLKQGSSVWIWVPVCREGRSHGWAGSLLCWESSLPFKALLLRGVEGRLLWGVACRSLGHSALQRPPPSPPSPFCCCRQLSQACRFWFPYSQLQSCLLLQSSLFLRLIHGWLGRKGTIAQNSRFLLLLFF